MAVSGIGPKVGQGLLIQLYRRFFAAKDPDSCPEPDRLRINSTCDVLIKSGRRDVKSPLRKGNQVNLFIDGVQAYPEIEKLIDQAKIRIDMEFFTFHDDPTGEKIASKLIEKVRQGVEVNVLLDNLSNIPNAQLLNIMAKAGVRIVRFSNGYTFPTLHPDMTTDHKKVILVDGKSGMLGGMNIAERYEKYWHDFMVRVEGPVLEDLYCKFEENWSLSGGLPLLPISVDRSAKGSTAAQVAITTPTHHEIRKRLMAAFDNAQERILIASPYFLDDELIEHLKQAAGRGVRVTAVIPDVGDNQTVDYINRFTVNDLISAGIQVYLYDTTNPKFPKHDHHTDIFNHGKVATIDGVWTSIGTANADTRSMQKSQEINLNIHDRQFAQEVERRIFDYDFRTRAHRAEPTWFSPLTWPFRQLLEGLDFIF